MIEKGVDLSGNLQKNTKKTNLVLISCIFLFAGILLLTLLQKDIIQHQVTGNAGYITGSGCFGCGSTPIDGPTITTADPKDTPISHIPPPETCSVIAVGGIGAVNIPPAQPGQPGIPFVQPPPPKPLIQLPPLQPGIPPRQLPPALAPPIQGLPGAPQQPAPPGFPMNTFAYPNAPYAKPTTVKPVVQTGPPSSSTSSSSSRSSSSYSYYSSSTQYSSNPSSTSSSTSFNTQGSSSSYSYYSSSTQYSSNPSSTSSSTSFNTQGSSSSVSSSTTQSSSSSYSSSHSSSQGKYSSSSSGSQSSSTTQYSSSSSSNPYSTSESSLEGHSSSSESVSEIQFSPPVSSGGQGTPINPQNIDVFARCKQEVPAGGPCEIPEDPNGITQNGQQIILVEKETQQTNSLTGNAILGFPNAETIISKITFSKETSTEGTCKPEENPEPPTCYSLEYAEGNPITGNVIGEEEAEPLSFNMPPLYKDQRLTLTTKDGEEYVIAIKNVEKTTSSTGILETIMAVATTNTGATIVFSPKEETLPMQQATVKIGESVEFYAGGSYYRFAIKIASINENGGVSLSITPEYRRMSQLALLDFGTLALSVRCSSYTEQCACSPETQTALQITHITDPGCNQRPTTQTVSCLISCAKETCGPAGECTLSDSGKLVSRRLCTSADGKSSEYKEFPCEQQGCQPNLEEIGKSSCHSTGQITDLLATGKPEYFQTQTVTYKDANQCLKGTVNEEQCCSIKKGNTLACIGKVILTDPETGKPIGLLSYLDTNLNVIFSENGIIGCEYKPEERRSKTIFPWPWWLLILILIALISYLIHKAYEPEIFDFRIHEKIKHLSPSAKKDLFKTLERKANDAIATGKFVKASAIYDRMEFVYHTLERKDKKWAQGILKDIYSRL